MEQWPSTTGFPRVWKCLENFQFLGKVWKCLEMSVFCDVRDFFVWICLDFWHLPLSPIFCMGPGIYFLFFGVLVENVLFWFMCSMFNRSKSNTSKTFTVLLILFTFHFQKQLKWEETSMSGKIIYFLGLCLEKSYTFQPPNVWKVWKIGAWKPVGVLCKTPKNKKDIRTTVDITQMSHSWTY